MPKGNHNNNRGRGNGRGGRGRGRGRGRGGPIPHIFDLQGGTSGRSPRQRYPHANAEIDFVVQQWAEEPAVSGTGGNLNRGKGPWRGGTPRSGSGTPSRGTDSPRRGDSTPGRGRGRGRGRGSDSFYGPRRPPVGFGAKGAARGKIVGKDAPLSELLFSERPLLRPVKFVPATLTPFLFQHSEELLKPTSDSVDTTEASHVPTADRVAKLFRGTTSDSESDVNASDELEEIDFADLAKVREEVEAIAAASKNQGARQPEEEIEEVDFADLAKIRAQVDAAEARQVSLQDTVVEETFTGFYNLKDANQTSSAMDIVDVDLPDGVQQPTAPPIPVTLDDPMLESSVVDGTFTEAADVIIVEEETNTSSNGTLDMLTDEASSLSPTPAIANPEETTPPPGVLQPTLTTSAEADDTPPIDNSPPLFVIDTAPSLPPAKRSTSDVILVDRAGRGETLGEEDELIVYAAPHPRSGRSSPMPNVPRVKLPNSSILSGRSFIAAEAAAADVAGLRSPVHEDELGEGVPVDAVATRERGPTRPKEDYLVLPHPDTSPENDKQPRSKSALKARKKEARLQRKRQGHHKRRRSGFGSFGAMMSEAMLREEDERERRLPRWETRRRGDSDIDWGTDDDHDHDHDHDDDDDEDSNTRVAGMSGVGADDDVEEISNGLGGMDLDPDLDLDVAAMSRFVKSMSGEGSRFVTMDDIEDEERMRREDEEGMGGPVGSSDEEGSEEDEEDEDEEDEDGDEEEAVFNVEEKIMIAESGGDEDDDDGVSEDSDDDDDDGERLSPKSSFQARLRKIRERSRGKHPRAMQDISDDEDDDEDDLPEPQPFTRGANDEEYLAHINDLLEENSAILAGRNRKKRNALFRNLHQGYVDEYDIEDHPDDPEFTTPVKSKKGKKGKAKQATGIFEAELQAQWEKDRAKKAEYKRQRAAARLAAALDPLSSSSPRSRISRKAMRAASRLDPALASELAPHAPTALDITTIESQLRRFVADVGGRQSLAFPPMDNSARKKIHELAAAFGLKSVSKGKGMARYTTVVKTSRTGVGVSERRVRAVMRRSGAWGRMPRHREGDEVGKEAPKIGESNVGFKMLASMGWSEGGRIGGKASVGIEAPLTAIIKNSKLGLGATR